MVDQYSQWRTNVVISGLRNVLINVMLSEAGYSSTVVRAKFPLFGLVHSRRRKVIAGFLNTPFAIPKLGYTSLFALIIRFLWSLSPFTRFLTILFTAPSNAFWATESYLRSMRRFPYYISKDFFTHHRREYYNLGYSMVIPRQFPFASFLLGYLEVFEIALFAIDMERLRENHEHRFTTHLETSMRQFKPQNRNTFKGFYSAGIVQNIEPITEDILYSDESGL